MGEYMIGIDIGTTGTKTVLLDLELGVLSQTTSESPLFSPSPAFAEADATIWEANAVNGILDVIAQAGVDPKDIVSISTTGMVPAVVCLDGKKRPLRHAILQNDARADREVDEVRAETDRKLALENTGSDVTQQSLAPTLRWLQKYEPGVWASTRYVVGSYDYVLIALGADLHVEENWALEAGVSTLRGERYLPSFEAGHFSPDLIPDFASPGSQVGTVARRVAEQLGLRAGTALVVGGADHVLSAYAASVNVSGDFLIKLGGAGDLLAVADKPIVDSRFYLDKHPRDGVWLPNGCMATSGSLLRWFQRLVGDDNLAGLDAASAPRKPAKLLCLPYFLGEKTPLNDPNLRGAFIGLDLSHDRADLYRSVLEAIAFGFRHNVDTLADAGIKFTRGLVTNGGSKSRLWKQIHADVLGVELTAVKGHPGASLGAAVLAAVGVNKAAKEDVVRYCTLDKQPFVPNQETRKQYEDTYALWLNATEQVTPIVHHLAANP